MKKVIIVTGGDGRFAKVLKNSKLKYFGVYCAVVGGGIIVSSFLL